LLAFNIIGLPICFPHHRLQTAKLFVTWTLSYRAQQGGHEVAYLGRTLAGGCDGSLQWATRCALPLTGKEDEEWRVELPVHRGGNEVTVHIFFWEEHGMSAAALVKSLFSTDTVALQLAEIQRKEKELHDKQIEDLKTSLKSQGNRALDRARLVAVPVPISDTSNGIVTNLAKFAKSLWAVGEAKATVFLKEHWMVLNYDADEQGKPRNLRIAVEGAPPLDPAPSVVSHNEVIRVSKYAPEKQQLLVEFPFTFIFPRK